MKIAVVSGTDICQPLLYHLASQKAALCVFYAAPTGPATAQELPGFCNDHQIPIVLETNNAHIYEWIKSTQPDIVFIAGYGRLLDEKRLGAVKYGVFNIHFGALPAYRGPSPVFWQLKNGEKTLDVCIHRLTARADAGPVVWRKTITNEEHYNYTFINQYLSRVLIEGVDMIIRSLASGVALLEFAQDDKKKGYHPRPSLKDVLIDWRLMPAQTIFNLCRACNNWNWGAITSYKGVEVKIPDISITIDETIREAGHIISLDGQIIIACTNGTASICFLSLNGIFFAARYAPKFGFRVGDKLGA
jgi:methionyl-tRNA formyltransferase